MTITSKTEYIGNLRTRSEHLKSGTLAESDAPGDNNGKGQLFSPTDLVATALSKCMITVMGIKAEKSGIVFSNISANTTKIMLSNPRRIGKIVVEFFIKEDWSDKEKKIMENTARTCPVANSLSKDVEQEILFNYL